MSLKGIRKSLTKKDTQQEKISHTIKQKGKIRYLKREDIKDATKKWNSLLLICLKPQLDDSNMFGSALAINNKYLAVGDSKANKVIIYNQDENWKRIREIQAPENSIPGKVGFGFGSYLALDKDILVILAEIQQANDEVTHPEYFQFKSNLKSQHMSIYMINLRKKSEVIRIDENAKKAVSNSSISARNNKIAFITSRVSKTTKYRTNQINLISDNNLIQIAENQINKNYLFQPYTLSLSNNLLLVSGNNHESYASNTYAQLFNLKYPQKEPQKLSIDQPVIGNGSSISEDFIVVTAQVFSESPDIKPSSRLIIRAIEEGTTNIMENSRYYFNQVSLDKNILLRMRKPHPFYGKSPGILEAFHLDQNATPYLVLKRVIDPQHNNSIHSAFLQEGFLMTLRNNRNICIEEINSSNNTYF